MKGLLAPLITAVVLVDALTYPPQYLKAEETDAKSLEAKPSNTPRLDSVYQNVPKNDQGVKPTSTEVVTSKQDTSEQPDDDDDDDDDGDDDDDEVDIKPTRNESVNASQTPKRIEFELTLNQPTPPVVKHDSVDDGLNKPAGIDFPDGEPTEKEFDRVETITKNNYITSTVYATLTSTITDCVSTVTDCDEKGTVVTKTISLYTTICPVTTPTSVAPPTDELDKEDSDSPESDKEDSNSPESDEEDSDEAKSEIPDTDFPESDLEPDTESDSDIPEAPEPTQGPYLTKTIETTVWYTVTDCAPKETDCPVGQQTSSISTLTEIYPMTNVPNFWSPNSTQTQPHATGSPSSYPELPHTNVTLPKTPPQFTINAGSAQKVNGLLMGFGLVAAPVIALLQGWF